MPGGRPPKPIGLKRLEGDTRQRGASQHEKSLAGAYEARRGRPPVPGCLTFRKIAEESVSAASQRRSVLRIAREHWVYLADELEYEKLLTKLDAGMLTSAALIYAQMVSAGITGYVVTFEKLAQRYMQIADRMGLNESARVKLPGRTEPKKDAGQSAMSKFLANRKSA